MFCWPALLWSCSTMLQQANVDQSQMRIRGILRGRHLWTAPLEGRWRGHVAGDGSLEDAAPPLRLLRRAGRRDAPDDCRRQRGRQQLRAQRLHPGMQFNRCSGFRVGFIDKFRDSENFSTGLGPQIVRMLQARPGRSGRQQQQQNSPSLGTAF